MMSTDARSRSKWKLVEIPHCYEQPLRLAYVSKALSIRIHKAWRLLQLANYEPATYASLITNLAVVGITNHHGC